MPKMIREFESKIIESNQEKQIKISELSQKIRQMKTLVEVYKSTQDNSYISLIKNGSKL